MKRWSSGGKKTSRLLSRVWHVDGEAKERPRIPEKPVLLMVRPETYDPRAKTAHERLEWL